MDFDDIGNKLANLTMYDVKQLYTAAKNYALNISEIEAKVNEATNDDAWGASSTLMQEIAAATQNFQDFNEIMPAIYRNFMEREAREWRQIYKALQLLEYIIKHGSERVVDDARSHLGTIKILRNFHYIDDTGKDQGINVRNRAKEIAELLSDVDRIRAERRKARQNRSKYQGASNSDFIPGSGTGRYGGFGSDSAFAMGQASGAGDYGGSSAGGRGGGGARDSFEAYDAGDDDEYSAGGNGSAAAASSRSAGRSSGRSAVASAPAPAKKQEKVVDLFSFDDDEPAPAASSASVAAAAPVDAFDDFDDFQGAPAPSAQPAVAAAKAPAAAKSGGSANVFDFLDSEAPPTRPALSSAGPSSSSTILSPSTLQAQRTPSSNALPTSANSAASKNTGSLNFDDLWASSSGKTSASSANANKGKLTMAEMAKQKSNSAVWGAASSQTGSAKPKDPFDFL